MKEILKYLRQTSSYTQEQIAKKLEISRQTYIKYENGEILPNEKIIRKLSIIYDVKEELIIKNEIPKLEETSFKNYQNDEEGLFLSIAEPNVCCDIDKKQMQIFDGFFDGNAVQILNFPENLNIKTGQKFKLFIENEEDEMKKRQKAFDTLISFKGSLSPEFDYKKALYEALDEKYESIN